MISKVASELVIIRPVDVLVLVVLGSATLDTVSNDDSAAAMAIVADVMSDVSTTLLPMAIEVPSAMDAWTLLDTGKPELVKASVLARDDVVDTIASSPRVGSIGTEAIFVVERDNVSRGDNVGPTLVSDVGLAEDQKDVVWYVNELIASELGGRVNIEVNTELG